MRGIQPMIALLSAAALVASATASCGGDDEISADGFVAQYAKALCDHSYRCCEGSERSYGSKPQCEQQVSERVGRLLAFTKEEQPGARFVASAASSCLARLAGECPAATTAADSCLDQVVRPERALGEDCKHDAECESYNCSLGDGTGACLATSVPGGSCGGEDRGCPEGYFCTSAKVCAALKESGDRCTGPNECTSGICNPSEKVCGGLTGSRCDGNP